MRPVFDRVLLSGDDVQKLMDWKEKHKGWVRQFLPAIQNGVIQVEEFYKLYFSTEKEKVAIVVYLWLKDKMTPFVKGAVDLASHSGKFEVMHLEEAIQTLLPEERNETINAQTIREDTFTLYCSVMAFLCHAPESVSQKTNTERVVKKSRHKDPHRGRKSKIRVVRHKTTDYHLNVLGADRRAYERHIESWSVRGHYRTLKSGKRVWVRPFTKGRGQREPKTYEL